MPDAAQIRAHVDRYVELFSANDREGWLDLFAADATMEDPVGTPVKEGRDAIGAFYDESHGMVDTLRLVLTGPVRVAAGEAAFPMQARPIMGDTEFVVEIIDAMTFADADNDTGALITSMRAFWDPAEMRPAD